MVFVIQNSQNRDGLALQIKLDEIIRAIGRAENQFIDLEDRSQEELDEIKAQFATIAVKGPKRKSPPPSWGRQKNYPKTSTGTRSPQIDREQEGGPFGSSQQT